MAQSKKTFLNIQIQEHQVSPQYLKLSITLQLFQILQTFKLQNSIKNFRITQNQQINKQKLTIQQPVNQQNLVIKQEKNNSQNLLINSQLKTQEKCITEQYKSTDESLETKLLINVQNKEIQNRSSNKIFPQQTKADNIGINEKRLQYRQNIQCPFRAKCRYVFYGKCKFKHAYKPKIQQQSIQSPQKVVQETDKQQDMRKKDISIDERYHFGRNEYQQKQDTIQHQLTDEEQVYEMDEQIQHSLYEQYENQSYEQDSDYEDDQDQQPFRTQQEQEIYEKWINDLREWKQADEKRRLRIT